MTYSELKQAQEMKEEIDNLDNFIHNAEMVWRGKLQIRKPRLFFRTKAYGMIHSEELELDTEMKDRVLQVVKNRRDELAIKLSEL